MNCSYCESKNIQKINHNLVTVREFYHCFNCDIIFVPKECHDSEEKEKQRYETHQNQNLDEGYIQHLSQAIEPVSSFIKQKPSFKILDYGCGKDEALSKLLLSSGIRVENYDLYFKPDHKIFENKWDFVFCTEVWEHFREPKSEIQKVVNLLSNDGMLVVMTRFHSHCQDSKVFKDWWYVKDFTHLCFYSENTFRYIAQDFNLEIVYIKNPVIVLGRS